VAEGGPARTREDPLADLTADELLRVMGHEIGNLITIVSGYGQMLRDHWGSLDDARRTDIVSRMNRQIDQLRVLIDNFQHLRWLTVTNGGTADVPVPTDVARLVTSMAEDVRPLAGDHPLTLDVEANLPPVLLDRAAVQHVLMNLVVNATKFSPPDDPIGIAVRCEEDQVRFEVVDRGPGIPAQKREEVFEKFVRLQRGGVGVGLGLFISRALLTSMGGRIWVEDREDGGTRMCFSLPVATSKI
jgi:two-component system, OmpR family, sensor histidine kinase KdpD